MSYIHIEGARENNLKNLDLKIEQNKITVLAGPSGSGKSSLAFGTLFIESQRRFINSFPNSFKFFSERPASVEVDSISPVLPVLALKQSNPILGSRAMVSDMIGVTDQLQRLFASESIHICPTHKEKLQTSDPLKKVKQHFEKMPDIKVWHLFVSKFDYSNTNEDLLVPSRSYDFDSNTICEFDSGHTYWEISRVKSESIEKLNEILYNSNGDLNYPEILFVSKCTENSFIQEFDQKLVCSECDFTSVSKSQASLFTPLNARGACPDCDGFGAVRVVDRDKIRDLNVSFDDGAIRVFKYSKFKRWRSALVSEMKSLNLRTNVPLSKLGDKGEQLIFEGRGKFPGILNIVDKIAEKKYKTSVRALLRGLEKDQVCSSCEGTRLNSDNQGFGVVSGKEYITLIDLFKLKIFEIQESVKLITKNENLSKATCRNLENLGEILKSCVDLGLGHLQLLRKIKSLSSGEYQRLLLVKYLSFSGTGSLFVLDEPALGLGHKEIKQIGKGVQALRNQGNTILIVEHNQDLIEIADRVIGMGPGSGPEGGQIVYDGNSQKYLESVRNLSEPELDKNKVSLELPGQKRRSSRPKTQKLSTKESENSINIKNASIFDLKFSNIQLLPNQINLVVGSSGSGKTALFKYGLANELSYQLDKSYLYDERCSSFNFTYPKSLKKIFVLDPVLNRTTSRSTVGSVTGLGPLIRNYLAEIPEAISMKLTPGHFSTNSDFGRCSECEGKGEITIELHYMEDMKYTCPECDGLKLRKEIAKIWDANSQLTVDEFMKSPLVRVKDYLKLTPKYQRVFRLLEKLRLTHLASDRQTNSLSGGEKQRLFLFSKLVAGIQDSLVIIENISFGLSAYEIPSLVSFVQDVLLDANNFVVLIDQNKQIAKIIDNHLKIQSFIQT